MIGKLGDLANLMKNAKGIQENMEAKQKELADTIVTGESGAGLVKVEMNGKHNVIKVNIDPELLKEEHEVIEDLITAAMNDANRKVNEITQNMMMQFGGMLDSFSGPTED